MNNNRRRLIGVAVGVVQQSLVVVEEIIDQETEARDNIPESLQGSERYYEIDAAVTSLEAAKDSLESAAESLEEAAGG